MHDELFRFWFEFQFVHAPLALASNFKHLTPSDQLNEEPLFKTKFSRLPASIFPSLGFDSPSLSANFTAIVFGCRVLTSNIIFVMNQRRCLFHSWEFCTDNFNRHVNNVRFTAYLSPNSVLYMSLLLIHFLYTSGWWLSCLSICAPTFAFRAFY